MVTSTICNRIEFVRVFLELAATSFAVTCCLDGNSLPASSLRRRAGCPFTGVSLSGFLPGITKGDVFRSLPAHLEEHGTKGAIPDTTQTCFPLSTAVNRGLPSVSGDYSRVHFLCVFAGGVDLGKHAFRSLSVGLHPVS